MWHLINVDSDGIIMKKMMKMVMIILMMVMSQKVFWKCVLLKTELVVRQTQFMT